MLIFMRKNITFVYIKRETIMSIRKYFNEKKIFGFSILQICILLVLIVFLFFFGENSLVKSNRYSREIQTVKKEIKQYQLQADSNKMKLEELNSSKANLEKFARENYMMKKDNEEVFIIK